MSASISMKKAMAVFARDGYRCSICRRELPPTWKVDEATLKAARDYLVVDHVNPRSNGGGNGMENLQTLCATCNLSKGGRPDAYIRVRSYVRDHTPVIIYPALAKMLPLKEAVLLSRVIYWSQRSYADGWVYKSAEDWADETALTYREQRRVRARLVGRLLMEENYNRVEHRMYFRPKHESVATILSSALSWRPDGKEAPDQSSGAPGHLTERHQAPDQSSGGTLPNVTRHLTIGQVEIAVSTTDTTSREESTARAAAPARPAGAAGKESTPLKAEPEPGSGIIPGPAGPESPRAGAGKAAEASSTGPDGGLPVPATRNPVKAVLDAYHAGFLARVGAKPVINGGKDGAAAKRLVAQAGLEAVLDCLALYFESTDAWVVDHGFTFGIFCSQINGLLAKRNGVRARGRTDEMLEGVEQFIREERAATKAAGGRQLGVFE